MHKVFWDYLSSDGFDLFTMVCLPEEGTKFPAVLSRTPYADADEFLPEEEVCQKLLETKQKWLDAGFAVVHQHCRGTGKSSGDCIPFIHERTDGLHLQNWVREQNFYNGEIYLFGGSYGASVHYVTAPFAPDIKGAVFKVQDCVRYNADYRNGFFKIGLSGNWNVKMYKKKTLRSKPYTKESFNMLPLKDFSKTVFGEPAQHFDAILQHPNKNDPFWRIRYGNVDNRDIFQNIHMPILLTTGFYDIYTGGIFDMWENMADSDRNRCALVVQPYGHNGKPDGEPVEFPGGTKNELCPDFAIKWFCAIRNSTSLPFKLGNITYYRLFENRWCTEPQVQGEASKMLPLGDGERTYTYDPKDPAYFKGGLCTNFGGCEFQNPPGLRQDILTVYTDAFEENVFLKGRMRGKLCVRSTAEDTCFYVRISVTKPGGDYGLRDDIHSICEFSPDYVPGEEAELELTFDTHAILIEKGQRLRIDISSSALPLYVRHTNNRGLFSQQTDTKIAKNTVVLSKSFLHIPIEKQQIG